MQNGTEKASKIKTENFHWISVNSLGEQGETDIRPERVGKWVVKWSRNSRGRQFEKSTTEQGGEQELEKYLSGAGRADQTEPAWYS